MLAHYGAVSQGQTVAKSPKRLLFFKNLIVSVHYIVGSLQGGCCRLPEKNRKSGNICFWRKRFAKKTGTAKIHASKINVLQIALGDHTRKSSSLPKWRIDLRKQCMNNIR